MAVAWDEFTAMRMAAVRRDSLLACGVIWATDLLEHGTRLDRLKLTVMRRLLRRFAFVWCLSPAQLEPLRSWLGGTDGPRIEVLPFGIDTRFFESTRIERRGVLSVGNDVDRDYTTLLKAFELLADRNPGLPIFVQGRGLSSAPPGVTLLERMTHRELRQRIREVSVLAVATRHNLHVSGMTAVLEAGSMGRSSVLTDTPGADMYLIDGASGFLAPEGDAAGLADQIQKALDRAEQHGDFAASHIRDHHSSAQMIGRLATIIADVVKGARP
ncbi:glycosyltransferase family 4 protein, partial [Microbacterium yannicii]|uniref:glycosyltransferase family 4 protein n=1 Tax=Microbacterium yannicii TaxID=671622 RepID=UPI00058F342D